jgi:hypothetical protein
MANEAGIAQSLNLDGFSVANCSLKKVLIMYGWIVKVPWDRTPERVRAP